MSVGWPPLSYGPWSATCDTLHAHTQVLGKLAVKLAPPEPQLQHAALLLSARGWETLPLPAPDGSGAIVAALDLHTHEAVVEHSGGIEGFNTAMAFYQETQTDVIVRANMNGPTADQLSASLGAVAHGETVTQPSERTAISLPARALP